ncbi:MAG: L,D-transpeptidase [Gammaproteobacteria bacterium]
MKKINACFVFCSVFLSLTSCSTYTTQGGQQGLAQSHTSYASRLPQVISSTQKTIYVDPNVHAWGAYNGGKLVYSGLATSGADYCPDIGRRCHTVSGTFHIYKLGNEECRSKTYPVGKGGALMPYCMFFSGGYSLHGSTEMGDGNYSHGCVRMNIADAEWVRYNFATVGTKVIVQPY